MRKFFLLVLLVFLITLPLMAGGDQEKEEEQAVSSGMTGSEEKFIVGSEPLEFSWWRAYDWSSDGTWPKRKGEEWIVENLQVQLELPGANGAAQQQLSFMIVEDDFYDVLQLNRGQDVEKLVAAGKLVPMDDWIDKYPNLKNEVGMDIINMLRSADGKLYQYPNWPIGPDRLNGNAGWFVNTEIYNSFSRPELKNHDDLYEYLKAVKADYPDIVPLEVGTEFIGFDMIFASFGNYLDGSMLRNFYAFPEGDRLTFITNSEAFKKAAVYTSKLFREGLITQDGFTQTRDQLREKLNTKRVAVMTFGDAAGEADHARTVIRQTEPNVEPYEFIHPITTDKVDLDEFRWMARNRLGWNVNVITKDAGGKAEKIFAFLDWMFGPYGSMVGRMGPPDLYWEDDGWEPSEERFPPIKPEFFEASAEDLKDLGHIRWVGNTSYADELGEILNELQPDPEKKNWKQTQFSEYIWRYAYDGTEYTNLVPPGDTDIGIIYQVVDDLMQQYYAEIIFASSEKEVLDLIKDAEKDAMDAGYGEVIAYMNRVWSENKVKLGKN